MITGETADPSLSKQPVHKPTMLYNLTSKYNGHYKISMGYLKLHEVSKTLSMGDQ